MKHIDCNTAQDWIVADLDRSLDDDLRLSLEEHMAQCPVCREAQTGLRHIWTALAGDMPVDLGGDFWKDFHASLLARMDTVSTQPRTGWRSWKLGWEATAVFVPAMVALVIVFLGSTRELPQQLPVDNATRQKLLTELNELYGPSSEEGVSAADLDQVKTELLRTRKATAGASTLTWFEVEDEPNPPHL